MARTRTFTLKPLPEDKQFRGQQALIIEHMKANPGSSIEQIADGIKPKLETRQDPTRVVAFYMTTWKKKGWVAVTEVEPEGSAAEGEGGETEQEEDDAEFDNGDSETEDAVIDEESVKSTGATVEERMEAAHEADMQAVAIRTEEKKTVSGQVLDLLGAGQQYAGDIASALGLKNAQVMGALSNLVRRGQVRKVGQGYELVS